MLFNTMPFWVFFPIVTSLYFWTPHRHRWVLLLAASYFFYGWWDVRFLILLLLSTIVDYMAGLGMAGEKLSAKARARISAILLAGTTVFLLPDWRAVQADPFHVDLAGILAGPVWEGAKPAIAIMVAIAVFGPLLYELYFLLPFERRRRAFLITSIVTNLGILGFFKYFNFFLDGAYGISDVFNLGFEHPDGPFMRMILPVGISFYTFQTMSYTIDVYRNLCPIERHFGRFALYVSLFPQLVAGPIERARHLLPQISERHHFDAVRVSDGLKLMFWGLFKKVCIADRLAIYVDYVYANPQDHRTGPTLLLATYFFAWQVYCDFSGYTDIARGAAKVMGFDLMENFRRPFFATTTIDVWRRWHISLSTWLRDYLYIPLGGNRKGVPRMYVNIMITMILGGLWHGASWNFVVWGGVQGVLLACSKATLPARDRIAAKLRIPSAWLRVFRVIVTFHLFCLSLIIFRTQTLGDALYTIMHIPTGWPHLRLVPSVTVYCFGFILFLFCVQLFQERYGEVLPKLNRMPVPVRFAAYQTIFFSIVLFGVASGTQFIYFAF